MVSVKKTIIMISYRFFFLCYCTYRIRRCLVRIAVEGGGNDFLLLLNKSDVFFLSSTSRRVNPLPLLTPRKKCIPPYTYYGGRSSTFIVRKKAIKSKMNSLCVALVIYDHLIFFDFINHRQCSLTIVTVFIYNILTRFCASTPNLWFFMGNFWRIYSVIFAINSNITGNWWRFTITEKKRDDTLPGTLSTELDLSPCSVVRIKFRVYYLDEEHCEQLKKSNLPAFLTSERQSWPIKITNFLWPSKGN